MLMLMPKDINKIKGCGLLGRGIYANYFQILILKYINKNVFFVINVIGLTLSKLGVLLKGNRVILGLEPVLSLTEKSCIASYYRDNFNSTNI